jgi:hypothetical protein
MLVRMDIERMRAGSMTRAKAFVKHGAAHDIEDDDDIKKNNVTLLIGVTA